LLPEQGRSKRVINQMLADALLVKQLCLDVIELPGDRICQLV
jgi:hypothetical protein